MSAFGIANQLAMIACAIAAIVPDAAGSVNVGDKPQLKVPAIDGSTIDLGALKGKLVLIDFWVGRSDLDRRNEELLKGINKTYSDQGLVLIGICCDPKISDATRYISELGITWPQHHPGGDWHSGMPRDWGVMRLNWDYLIGPDGTVLWIGAPSSAEEQIKEALIKNPPQLVDPRVLAKANADLDAVEKALADHDRAAAIGRLTRIAPEASKDRSFAARLKRISADIAKTADELLAEIEPLIAAKQYPQAAGALIGLSELFKGLPQEKVAREKLAALLADPQAKAAVIAYQREAEAAKALASARSLRDNGKSVAAYRKFKAVAQDYASTESGTSAADVVAAYEADATFMKQVHEDEIAAKAKPMLALADSYRSAGKRDQARAKYQEVIEQFPGTTFAQSARRAMAEMQN
jgi:hypothetical protein